MKNTAKCLVLDAMGVIFESADDVAELLIPFIAEHDGCTDEARIQAAYLEASLGLISAETFWARVDLPARLENDYLARFKLNPGVPALLALAASHGVAVWCLSNDVGRWSEKLRNNLGIESLLTGSVISGDIGVRKPDAEIYRILVESSGCRSDDMLFIDDRDKNVFAAREFGIDGLLFDAKTGFDAARNWISTQAPVQHSEI